VVSRAPSKEALRDLAWYAILVSAFMVGLLLLPAVKLSNDWQVTAVLLPCDALDLPDRLQCKQQAAHPCKLSGSGLQAC